MGFANRVDGCTFSLLKMSFWLGMVWYGMVWYSINTSSKEPQNKNSAPLPYQVPVQLVQLEIRAGYNIPGTYVRSG